MRVCLFLMLSSMACARAAVACSHDRECVSAQAERIKNVVVSGELPPRQTLDQAAIDRLEAWIECGRTQ